MFRKLPILPANLKLSTVILLYPILMMIIQDGLHLLENSIHSLTTVIIFLLLFSLTFSQSTTQRVFKGCTLL